MPIDPVSSRVFRLNRFSDFFIYRHCFSGPGNVTPRSKERLYEAARPSVPCPRSRFSIAHDTVAVETKASCGVA